MNPLRLALSGARPSASPLLVVPLLVALSLVLPGCGGGGSGPLDQYDTGDKSSRAQVSSAPASSSSSKPASSTSPASSSAGQSSLSSAASVSSVASASALSASSSSVPSSSGAVVSSAATSSLSSSSVSSSSAASNHAPLADAGRDSYTYVGASISLDAGASSDADGDTLSYSWSLVEQPLGSTASLSNASSQQPSLVADVAGIYRLSLQVSDGQQQSQLDEVQITAAHWLINNTTRSTYIKSGGLGVLVNVQSLVAGQDSLTVNATGIPDYQVLMTQADVDALNNRPKAATEFVGGATSAIAGATIDFGQSIGFKTTGPGCALGYWPPGPACPSNQSKAQSLPSSPQPADTACSTAINSVGLMLNGTSIFNWDDGQSYNSQNVWNNLAPVFEQYDVDICQGHAQQQGNYHHHMYSGCLKDLLGDDGSGHSPIYGFAADGYPIYGPYYMQGVLAKPSWVKRDYSAGSASGCGSDGARSCQLVDQYDLTKGTKSVTAGPSTSSTVTTQSGNSISAVSGVYFEDYYWDSSLAAKGGEYLDEHNGHDHDGLGYHYHITAELVAGKLSPVFPYQIGPKFYGALPDGTFAICGN